MSESFDPRRLQVGASIPSLSLPPITRHQLALYCGGSGDHNPIHVDIDFARSEAGLEDVIAHGMLAMAFLGRLLTERFGSESIARLKTRFLAPIHVGDALTCSAEVANIDAEGIQLVLSAVRGDGKALLSGEATVRLA